MALIDSNEAIGAVSELLQTRLHDVTKVNVDVGRPDAAAGTTGRKFNLFLYRVGIDAGLRSVALDYGQEAPLWLVAYYLLTAFEDKDSDSVKAHRLLGKGLAALHGLNYIHPAATDTALTKNPEPLKITFDDADVEMLSKIMQGSDEKYRVSMAFQVRPVMIMPESVPAYAPLVKTVGPGTVPPGPVVVPSLGARLEAVEPDRLEADSVVTLHGADLGGYDQAWFGDTPFPVVLSADGSRTVAIPDATALSAGAYPVVVSRTMPDGKLFTSNAVLGRLMPRVSNVVLGPRTPAPGGPPVRLAGTFTINGHQLGGPEDAIFAALFRDGETKLMLELTGTAAQTSLNAAITDKQALPPGDYLLILRVNGEQAADSPAIGWV